MNKCGNFPACGGCTLRNMDAGEYVATKLAMLDGIECGHLRGLTCIGDGARRRTRFQIDYGANVGFYKAHTNEVVPVAECPNLLPEINAVIEPLRKLFKSLARRYDGAVEVVATDNGLSLRFNMDIAQIDRKKVEDFIREYATPEPYVMFGDTKVPYVAGMFLQPSKESQDAIVETVRGFANGAKHIADLFSGLGLFTFSLAEPGRSFTAYDCDKKAIAGMKKLGANTHVADLFKKPVKDFDSFDLAILDPPREGAQTQAKALANSNLKHVIYVSCNPATFKRDAQILGQADFKIGEIAPIDQFPYTRHLELVADLLRA
ncbi:MAG: hypothetical protein LBL52_03415 [Rickettsiales bacterium]|jgi:23S rRNA (uracil1939-C5)-methyltransferase|nr:hypothetical protein [Rickettsiales bacterium]